MVYYATIYIDLSRRALRHAMANVVAVVFALPAKSNHLWFNLFEPHKLRGTYPAGYMVNQCFSVVKFAMYGLLG